MGDVEVELIDRDVRISDDDSQLLVKSGSTDDFDVDLEPVQVLSNKSRLGESFIFTYFK